MSAFSPSAAFLLELAWPNLFEMSDAREIDPWSFRCKGCGTMVKRTDREKHYRRHKRTEHARREKEIQRARVASLAKARQARGRRAA